MVRRTPIGYRFIVTPRRFSVMVGGQPLDDTLLQTLLSMVVVYDVDQDGRLVDMTSGSNVNVELDQFVPKAIKPAADQLFGEDALFAKHKAEWDARYADLAGRELDWGSGFGWTSEFISPSGVSTTFHGSTVLLDGCDCNGRKCCRLRYAYVASPDGVRGLMNQLFRAMDINEELALSEIAGEGERVIEPDTLLIHSETARRTGDTALMFRGVDPGVTRFEEIHQWTYVYQLQ